MAAFLLLSLLFVSLLAGCGGSVPVIEVVPVPHLTGATTQEAQAFLQEAGLEMGETRETYNDDVPPGEVISTTPPYGEELEKGSTVALTISKGPEMVPMPALLGSAEADALAALQAQGFQAEVQRDYNESVGAGLVCAMQPAPNAAVMRGSKVVVTVSQGSAYVTCSTCGGDGSVTAAVTCPECGGSGVCYT
jgi:serine/threonine-protein kinase